MLSSKTTASAKCVLYGIIWLSSAESMEWVLLMQPALPCSASLAASWCKALVQEIANSLRLGGNAGAAQ